jgi:hypothetical protein
MSSREVKWSAIHLPGKVFLPLVMALLLNSLLPSTAWAERHRKVLMLYDENTDFPALALLDRGLKEAFKAGTTDRVDFYTESMDLARFQKDAGPGPHITTGHPPGGDHRGDCEFQ